MMLDNKTSNKIIDTFNYKYAQLLIDKCNVLSNHTILVLSKTQYQYCELYNEFKNVDYDDTPLWFVHSSINDDFVIIIDFEFCSRLKLSDDEIMASIAHEIGHIMYYFHDNYDDNDDMLKELIADRYAIGIGLGKPLISTLEKLIKYHEDSCQVIKMRVDFAKFHINELV